MEPEHVVCNNAGEAMDVDEADGWRHMHIQPSFLLRVPTAQAEEPLHATTAIVSVNTINHEEQLRPLLSYDIFLLDQSQRPAFYFPQNSALSRDGSPGLPAAKSSLDASTVYNTTSTVLTSNKTHYTNATSLEQPSVLGSPKKKSTILDSIMEKPSDAEDLEQLLKYTDHESAVDYESTISADSIYLTVKQSENIVTRFTKAILSKFPPKNIAEMCSTAPSRHIIADIEQLLKDFSKITRRDAAGRGNLIGSKAIRRLRGQISEQCVKIMLFDERDREESRLAISIGQQAELQNPPQMCFEEKVQNWQLEHKNQQNVMEDTQAQSSRTETKENLEDSNIFPSLEVIPEDAISCPKDCGVSSSSDAENSELPLFPEYLDDNKVYEYLTTHPGFSGLTSEIWNLLLVPFRRRHLNLIHDQIHSCLEQCSESLQSTLAVVFLVDWDVVSFLQTQIQYPAGAVSDLGQILTITGETIDAQMTTVSSYLRQTWPDYPTEILEAIETAVRSPIGEVRLIFDTNSIEVKLQSKSYIVRGSKDFITAVGQQLAWLGASCRESIGEVACCNLSFDLESFDARVTPYSVSCRLGFEIKKINEAMGCWTRIVGDYVIATGFPIATRDAEDIGILIDIEVMAQLVGVRLMATYGGAWLLKGRYHAFVPVKRRGSSIQWHLVDTWPNRLQLSDIVAECPEQLLTSQLGIDEIHVSRHYLGWCGSVDNHLATTNFDYLSVGYSSSLSESRTLIELTGGAIGVAKVASGTLNFRFTRKDGVHLRARSDYYDDILNDARDINIVLQDTRDHRCWLTDAERLILHIIIHRSHLQHNSGSVLS